jgi:MFS family permease
MRHVLRLHSLHIGHPRYHAADLSMTFFSSTKTPPDILCLYGARALRGFGDGFAIIILPVYLSAIGFSPQQIGIVASASLLGTAALTLITGFIAPRFELRRLF